MRKIKFRAWHRVSKKMFDVLSIDLDPEFGGVWKWGKAYHDHDTGEHEADKDFIVHDQIELMQFTGLKDKNGKEIYEGDILKATPYYRNRPVLWEDVVQGLVSSNDEVIGNIYENPELVNVK